MVVDDKIHKVIFAFMTGYHQNASDFDSVTGDYGLSVIYDVVALKDYKEEVYIPDPYEAVAPDHHFDIPIDTLIFNTDYENKTQESMGGILNPNPEIEVKANTLFPLMCNFGEAESDSVLVILTVQFTQTTIDHQKYLLFKTNGAPGTGNQQIKIKTPETPGSYEVIGFIIKNPFERNLSPSNRVATSVRFTLHVI